MRQESVSTYWARIYMSGPINVARQVMREECLREGLCVTIEKTDFIYTGGEEKGFVVGLINYPRFPKKVTEIRDRARTIMEKLLTQTHQHSALMMTPDTTEWVTRREENKA